MEIIGWRNVTASWLEIWSTVTTRATYASLTGPRSFPVRILIPACLALAVGTIFRTLPAGTMVKPFSSSTEVKTLYASSVESLAGEKTEIFPLTRSSMTKFLPVRSLMNLTMVEMSTSLKLSTTPFAAAGMGVSRIPSISMVVMMVASCLFNGASECRREVLGTRL